MASLRQFLRWLFGYDPSRQTEEEWLFGPDASRQTEQEKGKIWRIGESVHNARTNAGHCPNCDGAAFIEGPSGGLSVNVECRACGLLWNANWVGMSWQYIGNRRERHL